MDLGDQRRSVACQEPINPRDSSDEIARQLREWRFAYHPEQSNLVADYCLKFVRLVADTGAMSYRDPASCADNGVERSALQRRGYPEPGCRGHDP